ncbi:hypothetical protein AGOR_G00125040 [Albula goreensis]|uniref:Ig-like domain-containing protein n=1 Tax=Albula goreensis TaxID=1534307 RepID=A0A8T3DBA6_9TELE|nr:hypothetical protein AGOR_G00125040 [Albula goreensis]
MLNSLISLNDSSMVVLALQLLGFALNVWAQSPSDMEMEMELEVEVDRNVTGVLGEYVLLRCQYRGQKDIIMSSWTQREGLKSKQLAGWHQQAFVNHKDFSKPASASNLTVRMLITRLEAEQEYKCAFTTFEEAVDAKVFLNVLVPPDVHMYVEEKMENGTHYQMTTIENPNGTVTQTSVLQFPTHLQEAGEVTCTISHPALSEPQQVTKSVQTFVAPTVTLETQNEEEGKEYLKVICVAAGARPAPDIAWQLPGDTPEGSPAERVQQDKEANAVTVTSSVLVQAHLYEGEDITCIVTHPKLPHGLQKNITLPIYELSSVKVLMQESGRMHPENQVEGRVALDEGQRNVAIHLEVTGNVPHYKVNCSRENGSLPAGMEVTGNVLHLEGPAEPHYAGLYTCQASYYSHRLNVPLEIVVTPVIVQPVVICPSIKIQTMEDMDQTIIECSASEAIPAANVSWKLPGGLSGTIQPNTTFQNGTYSVTSVLLLPICLAQEHVVECVIEHPALVDTEIQPITLPMCINPKITTHTSTVWDKNTEYTEVECAVDGGKHRASISWYVKDSKYGANEIPESLISNNANQSGSEMTHSLLRFPTRVYTGQVVVCSVDHPALEAPERREIQVTSAGRRPSYMGVSVRWQRMSPLWLAICGYRGDAASVNVTWVLPDNSTGRTAFHSGHEEGHLWANSTYEFPLALYEGKNLTCLIQHDHSIEERILHVPSFYISSLRLLNKTTSYRWIQEESSAVHRVALQAHLASQRILLKVYGNAPWYNFTCSRSDGSAVRTEGSAMVFPSEVSERDAGLYTCHASFYHHSTSVPFQVDVDSGDFQLWMLAVICFSSAAAVSLILFITLCIFCKRNGGDPSRSEGTCKKRESLAALTSLMQDPCSPELKKPLSSGRNCQEYAELVRYSIVIDVKTTV